MNELAAAREESRYNLAAEVLRSTGQLRIKAIGTSMLPTLWPGDLLTIRLHEFERVLPGELILYARQNRFFVHRVIRKLVRDRCHMLVTRGDALPHPDLPIGAQDFLGKVVAIERAGRFLTNSTTRTWWGSLLGLVLSRCDWLRAVTLRLQRARSGSMNAGVCEVV